MNGAAIQLHAASSPDQAAPEPPRGARASQGRTPPVREKRRGAIAAYSGTVGALLREAGSGGLAQRVRTYAEDHASDLQRAIALLRGIEGLGIVVHGPACRARTVRRSRRTSVNRWRAAARSSTPSPSRFFTRTASKRTI